MNGAVEVIALAGAVRDLLSLLELGDITIRQHDYRSIEFLQ